MLRGPLMLTSEQPVLAKLACSFDSKLTQVEPHVKTQERGTVIPWTSFFPPLIYVFPKATDCHFTEPWMEAQPGRITSTSK